MVSSSLKPADKKRAGYDPGVAGFITKPISWENVKAVLSEIKQ